MAQLSDESGMPVATIKYYLREGLLPAGVPTSANQTDYSIEHVRRLRLIRALIDVGRLPIAVAREVLAAVDSEGMPLSHVFGIAQAAITSADPIEVSARSRRTVDELVAARGWTVSSSNPGRAGVARVLDAYERTGHPELAVVQEEYAAAAELIARADLDAVARNADVSAMAETVVVGTILGDSLIAALRRMAQENDANHRYPPNVPEGNRA